MSQSPESFFVGLFLVALVAGSAAYSGSRLRAAFLPGWLGAAGFLAASMISLAILLLEASLLGAVGLLEPWALVVLGLAVALILWLRPIAPRGSGEGPPARVAVPFGAGAVAVLFGFFTVAQWGSLGSLSLDFGIGNFDSVW